MKKRSSKNSSRGRRKKKKNRVLTQDVDRISELPDDILVFILSLLTFREATTTKILSTRWGRRLDSPTNVISFDYIKPQQPVYHISRINDAIDSYKGGQRIDKFKIDIPVSMLSEANSYLEKWLEFALSRDTDILDIRMIHGKEIHTRYNYDHRISSFMGNSTLPGLKYLKELSLSRVYVSDYGTILRKLVALERLSIKSPPRRRDITLFDEQPSSPWKLKHLNISNFSDVSNVRVFQLINLVSLKIHGLDSYRLFVENVPKLVHVSILKARLKERVSGFLPTYQFVVYSQLLRLRLYIDLLDRCVRRHVSPNFAELKHMELDIAIDGECNNHHQLFSWVETCPSMKELQIKFLWPSEVAYQYRKLDKDVIERKAEIDRLRTLRLSGYRGTVSELEFVLYVVKNAANLKDLIVVEDRHKNHAAVPPKKFSTPAFKHLKSLIPSYVNFVSV